LGVIFSEAASLLGFVISGMFLLKKDVKISLRIYKTALFLSFFSYVFYIQRFDFDKFYFFICLLVLLASFSALWCVAVHSANKWK